PDIGNPQIDAHGCLLLGRTLPPVSAGPPPALVISRLMLDRIRNSRAAIVPPGTHIRPSLPDIAAYAAVRSVRDVRPAGRLRALPVRQTQVLWQPPEDPQCQAVFPVRPDGRACRRRGPEAR